MTGAHPATHTHILSAMLSTAERILLHLSKVDCQFTICHHCFNVPRPPIHSTHIILSTLLTPPRCTLSPEGFGTVTAAPITTPSVSRTLSEQMYQCTTARSVSTTCVRTATTSDHAHYLPAKGPQRQDQADTKISSQTMKY